MILKDAKFDKHHVARLGEDPGEAGENNDQVMELQRRTVSSTDGKPSYHLFDLIIYVGDEDLTFYGMRRESLKLLAAMLAELADAPANAEPK